MPRQTRKQPAEPANPATTREAEKQLQSIVSRIETLEEQKKEIADDIKDVYAEAKGNGYDVKVLREIIRIRKQATAERLEREAIKTLYMSALGMLADTPLGRAAIERETATEATLDALRKIDGVHQRRRARQAEPAHDSDGVIHEPDPDDVPHALGTEEFDDLDPPANPGRVSVTFKPEHAPVLRAAAEKLRRGEVDV